MAYSEKYDHISTINIIELPKNSWEIKRIVQGEVFEKPKKSVKQVCNRSNETQATYEKVNYYISKPAINSYLLHCFLYNKSWIQGGFSHLPIKKL